MSVSSSNIWNFDIFDFFVGVVSGLVTWLVIYTLNPEFVLSLFPNIDVLILVFFGIIISYILGRIVEQIARSLEGEILGKQKPFDHEMVETRNSKHGEVHEKFLKGSQKFFGLDINWDDEIKRVQGTNDLFMCLRSYLTTNNISTRVERFQVSYLLFRNLYFSFLLGTILHLAKLLLYFDSNGVSLDVPVQYPVSIFGFLALSYISYGQRVRYHQRMVKVMIYSFYSEELRNCERLDDTCQQSEA